LKESPYIKEDRLTYNVITDDMVKNVWSIPGVRLLFDDDRHRHKSESYCHNERIGVV
jgi:hypothetical protein